MTTTKTARRVQLIPLIMTIVGVGLMFSLGTWQLVRLQWKESLISSIDAAMKLAPDTITTPEHLPASLQEYRKLSIKGVPISGKQVFLTPRYFRGKLGYSVCVPVRLAAAAPSQPHILVNVGWITAEMKKDFHYPVTAEEVTFEGLVRHPIPKGTFTPENSAEKNLWFYTDMQEISQFLGVPLAPVMLDVVGQQVPGSYPIPSDGKVALRNDHLGYAITWFAVGIAGLVIFLLYTRNTRRPA